MSFGGGTEMDVSSTSASAATDRISYEDVKNTILGNVYGEDDSGGSMLSLALDMIYSWLFAWIEPLIDLAQGIGSLISILATCMIIFVTGYFGRRILRQWVISCRKKSRHTHKRSRPPTTVDTRMRVGPHV